VRQLLHNRSHNHNRNRSPQLVIRISLLLLLLATLPACACGCPIPSPLQQDWTRTDLYFGLTRRDKSLISDADFQKFIDTTVTPLFPNGFTLTPATGQYLDSQKTLHQEPTRVLTILYQSKDAQQTALKIQQITQTYCRNFNQQSVLKTTTPTTATFLTAN
jgi:hypothetical protein